MFSGGGDQLVSVGSVGGSAWTLGVGGGGSGCQFGVRWTVGGAVCGKFGCVWTVWEQCVDIWVGDNVGSWQGQRVVGWG